MVGNGLEQQIATQLYEALQGSVIRFVLKNAEEPSDDDIWRSRMEGHRKIIKPCEVTVFSTLETAERPINRGPEVKIVTSHGERT